MKSAAERARAVRDKAAALAGSVPVAASSTQAVWRLHQAMSAAVSEANDLVTTLSQGNTPSLEAYATVVTSGAEAIAQLAERVHALELQVAELTAQVKQLQQEAVERQGDSNKLLLRQMATQTVNKLARVADPSKPPHFHGETTLVMVKSQAPKVYAQYTQAYPDLKAAVSILCSQGRAIAHPMPVPPPTPEHLESLIKAHVPEASQPAVQSLLKCLVQLAGELDEELFVSTERP